METSDCGRVYDPVISEFKDTLRNLTDHVVGRIKAMQPSRRSCVVHEILCDLTCSHTRMVERLLRLARDECRDGDGELCGFHAPVATQPPVERSTVKTEKDQWCSDTEVQPTKRLRTSLPVRGTSFTAGNSHRVESCHPELTTHKPRQLDEIESVQPSITRVSDSGKCRYPKLTTHKQSPAPQRKGEREWAPPPASARYISNPWHELKNLRPLEVGPPFVVGSQTKHLVYFEGRKEPVWISRRSVPLDATLLAEALKIKRVVPQAPMASSATGTKRKSTRACATSEATDDFYMVEDIVAHRGGNDGKKEYLVKWEGFSKELNTWESAKKLYTEVPEIVDAYEAQQAKKYATRSQCTRLPTARPVDETIDALMGKLAANMKTAMGELTMAVKDGYAASSK